MCQRRSLPSPTAMRALTDMSVDSPLNEDLHNDAVMAPSTLSDSEACDSDTEGSECSAASLPKLTRRMCNIDSNKLSDVSDSDDHDGNVFRPEQSVRTRPAVNHFESVHTSPSIAMRRSPRHCGRRGSSKRGAKMGHKPLKYPRHSDVVPISAIEQKAAEKQTAPVQLTLRKQDRESFLESVSPRVQALVSQPFGKENLLQCFKSEARFSHVLIPLWKSGCLPTDDWDILETASHEAATLMTLIRDVQDLDFAQLQGFRSDDFMADTAIDDQRVRLATAALICFDGDPAALVRWMGGSHVEWGP